MRRLDMIVAYGLIVGAAAGSLLFVVTGEVLMVAVAPGVGLLLGLVAAGLLGAAGRDDDGMGGRPGRDGGDRDSDDATPGGRPDRVT